MTDPYPVDPPSPFIVEWVARLSHEIPAPRRALDLAMGRGRHALVMAASGCRVFGVDVNPATVAVAMARASQRGYQVRGWCADLTVSPLPSRRFELIVVTRYLQRDLCGAIANALVPGGAVLYETFTELQRARGLGPTSPDHLLKTAELPLLFADLEPIFYEEVTDPGEDALARLAARRRSSPS
jgi:tellurite methyltransferase